MKTIPKIRRASFVRVPGTALICRVYLRPVRKFAAIIVRPIQTMSREVVETYLMR